MVSVRRFLTTAAIVMTVVFVAAQPQPQAIRDCAAISQADPRLAPLAEACETVKQMQHTLPNFVCNQEAQRYVPILVSVRHSEERRPDDIIADTVTAVATYEDGVTRYSDIKVNDVPKMESSRTCLESLFLASSAPTLFHYFSTRTR